MNRVEHRPVVLDCGCEVRPELGQQNSTLVVCPGHQLRHMVTAERLTIVTYTAQRIDPPDPRPEDEEDEEEPAGGE